MKSLLDFVIVFVFVNVFVFDIVFVIVFLWSSSLSFSWSGHVSHHFIHTSQRSKVIGIAEMVVLFFFKTVTKQKISILTILVSSGTSMMKCWMCTCISVHVYVFGFVRDKYSLCNYICN